MIENIRNYSGLMIIVLVGLFLAFLFSDVNHLRGMGGNKAVIEIEGTTYDRAEYMRLGKGSKELVMYMQMYQLYIKLSGFSQSEENADETFFIRRMIVRKAKDEFGIVPSDEEVSNAIRSNRFFTDKDGKFDEVRYRGFIEQQIGHLGLTENDVRELVSDDLVIQKLSTILGSGLGSNEKIVAEQSALTRQQVTAQIARIDLEKFKETIKPTDEEIKAYWEKVQDVFRTEPRRKFTYFIAEAKLPEVKPAEAPKPEAGKEGEAAKPEKPDPTKADPKLLEERQRKLQEFNSEFDDLFNDIQQKKGANFEELPKSKGYEIKSTDFFTASAPPAELNLPLYQTTNNRGSNIVSSLFSMKITSDAFSRISDVLPVGEGKYFMARLDGEEPSRVKTFDEAKEEARKQYIDEKAAEAMRKHADELLKKVREAVAGGKSFADATKEAGLESKTVGPVTQMTRPATATEPASLFESVSRVDPGSVADLIVEPTQIFIALVEKREVVKQPDAAAAAKNEAARAADFNENIAFDAWISERVANANVKRLNRTSN